MNSVCDIDNKKEIRPLTGLRAVAAWMVILYHLTLFGMYDLNSNLGFLAEFIVHSGYLAVDLFFILSGFIIAYNYHDHFERVDVRKWVQFLINRLARIYPVHIFAMLLMIYPVLSGLEAIWSEVSGKPLFIVKNLLLIHAWRVPSDTWYHGPSWSLSCEWLAYLTFPMVMVVFNRIKNKWLLWTLIPMMILPVAIHIITGVYKLHASAGVLIVLPEFAAGVALFQIFRLSPDRRREVWWSGIIISTALLMFYFSLHSHLIGIWAFWLTPLYTVVIYFLAMDKGVIARILGSKVMVFAGRISFSLYMTHIPVLYFLKKFFPVAAPEQVQISRFLHGTGLWMPLPGQFEINDYLARFGYFVLYIAVMHIVATVTWLLVEERMRRKIRNLVFKSDTSNINSVEKDKMDYAVANYR